MTKRNRGKKGRREPDAIVAKHPLPTESNKKQGAGTEEKAEQSWGKRIRQWIPARDELKNMVIGGGIVGVLTLASTFRQCDIEQRRWNAEEPRYSADLDTAGVVGTPKPIAANQDLNIRMRVQNIGGGNALDARYGCNPVSNPTGCRPTEDWWPAEPNSNAYFERIGPERTNVWTCGVLGYQITEAVADDVRRGTLAYYFYLRGWYRDEYTGETRDDFKRCLMYYWLDGEQRVASCPLPRPAAEHCED